MLAVPEEEEMTTGSEEMVMMMYLHCDPCLEDDNEGWFYLQNGNLQTVFLPKFHPINRKIDLLHCWTTWEAPQKILFTTKTGANCTLEKKEWCFNSQGKNNSFCPEKASKHNRQCGPLYSDMRRFLSKEPRNHEKGKKDYIKSIWPTFLVPAVQYWFLALHKWNW